MAAILDYQIKTVFHFLTEDSRWNVLSVLILHANVRNRAWPKMDTITRMGTNGNREIAHRAKKWLIDHKAIELVTYDKRVGEEVRLHQSRHVYQLTGRIEIANQDGQPQTYAYLHFNNAPAEQLAVNSSGDKHLPAKSSGDKSSGAEPHNNNQLLKQNQSLISYQNKQQTTPARHPVVAGLNICLPQEISNIFGNQIGLAGELIDEHTEKTVLAWCQYAATQTGIINPIGLVRAKLNKKEPVPTVSPAPKPAPAVDYSDYESATYTPPTPKPQDQPTNIPKSERDSWEVTCDQLELQFDRAVFNKSLKGAILQSIDPDGTLVIKARNKYTLTFLQGLCYEIIKRTLNQIRECSFDADPIGIRFVAADTPTVPIQPLAARLIQRGAAM